jgi:hypothetical protein
MHDQTQQQPTYHQRSGEYMSSKRSVRCTARSAARCSSGGRVSGGSSRIGVIPLPPPPVQAGGGASRSAHSSRRTSASSCGKGSLPARGFLLPAIVYRAPYFWRRSISCRLWHIDRSSSAVPSIEFTACSLGCPLHTARPLSRSPSNAGHTCSPVNRPQKHQARLRIYKLA